MYYSLPRLITYKNIILFQKGEVDIRRNLFEQHHQIYIWTLKYFSLKSIRSEIKSKICPSERGSSQETQKGVSSDTGKEPVARSERHSVRFPFHSQTSPDQNFFCIMYLLNQQSINDASWADVTCIALAGTQQQRPEISISNDTVLIFVCMWVFLFCFLLYK